MGVINNHFQQLHGLLQIIEQELEKHIIEVYKNSFEPISKLVRSRPCIWGGGVFPDPGDYKQPLPTATRPATDQRTGTGETHHRGLQEQL